MALKIYNASAGSGKTFTLVKEYILLALNGPGDAPYDGTYYRSILAITFTKKAAAEMRDRVIKTLHALTLTDGDNLPDDFKTAAMCGDQIRQELAHLGYNEIYRRAGLALTDMLEHYEAIQITTIDSFFMKVIKSFAVELGLSPRLDVQLDLEQVCEEVRDAILSKINVEEELSKKVIDLLKTRQKYDEKYELSTGLYQLIAQLYSADFQKYDLELVKRNAITLEDISLLREIRRELAGKYFTFFKQQEEKASQLGLEIEHFSGKASSGLLSKITKEVASSSIKFDLTASQLAKILEGKAGINDTASAFCSEFLSEFELEILPLKTLVNTLDIFISQSDVAVLIGDIKGELSNWVKNQRKFILADNNPFLQQIIDGQDNSFIYEKLGQRLNHIFIDEFQDTSQLQYANLRPLITEILSKGNDCLIVGDLKQSIYSWRGGDMSIMQKQLYEDFDNLCTIELKTLGDNYRSARSIVEFNNLLYATGEGTSLPLAMARQYSNQFEVVQVDGFSQTYASAHQDVNSSKAGFVEVVIYDNGTGGEDKVSTEEGHDGDVDNDGPDKIPLYLDEKLPALLRELQIDYRYKASDICFLVRKSSEVLIINDILQKAAKKETYNNLIDEKKLSFTLQSPDSYLLSSSKRVTLLVACLAWLANRGDKVAEMALVARYLDYAQISEVTFDTVHSQLDKKPPLDYLPKALLDKKNYLVKLPLVELVAELMSILGFDSSVEAPYLHSFQDLVLGYVSESGSDILGFLEHWKEEGSQTSIEIPKEDGTIKVMTIHSAKGLEFPVVIMPFADWTHWVSKVEVWQLMSRPIIEQLSIHTDNHVEGLGRLAYAQPFFTNCSTEKWNNPYLKDARDAIALKCFIESLNLMYVATTRPEERLYLLAGVKQSKKDSVSKNAGFGVTLDDVLKSRLADYRVASLQDGEIAKYHFKESVPKKQEVNEGAAVSNLDTMQQRSVQAISWRTKLTFAQKRKDFFTSGKYLPAHADKIDLDSKRLGVIIHEILSRTENSGAFGLVLDELERSGEITQGLRLELSNMLYRFMQNPQLKAWFDTKDYMIKNEQPILNQYGGLVRMDRVMLNEQEAIVIDFKTGLALEKQRNQVKDYMAILKEMYPQKKVKGYLAFLTGEEVRIEEVA